MSLTKYALTTQSFIMHLGDTHLSIDRPASKLKLPDDNRAELSFLPLLVSLDCRL
jgi:hypothetical protein